MVLKKKFKSNISGKLFLNKNPEKIKEINHIRQNLLDKELEIKEDNFSSFIFKNKKNSKKILKMLLKNIFFSENNRITDSFLKQFNSSYSQRYKPKLSLPLNSNQIKILLNNTKLSINIQKSKFLFVILILINYFKGILLGLYVLSSSLISKILESKTIISKKDFIYFDIEVSNKDLEFINKKNNYFVINQVLKKLRLKESFNIIVRKSNSNYFNILSKTNFFLGKNRIFFRSKPYSNICTLKNFIFFFSWFLFSILICLKDLFFLKWYNAFLFSEAVKSKLFDFCDNNFIPKIYLISYQGSLSRALWTLDHYKKVRRTYLYFYSTNGDGYITRYSKTENLSHWSELEYDHYLTWDKYQKQTLKSNLKIKNPKISIVGPMLNFIGHDLKEDFKNYILIFDVVPLRLAFEITNTFTILKANYLKKFSNDIIKLCDEKGYNVVHKMKKDIDNKIVSKKYIHNLKNNLKNKKNYFVIDKNCSIENLILNSKGVISFPYTSTAIMAHSLKKPSIYYDPSKLIDEKNKKFSHGIDVCNNLDDLKNWLNLVKN